MRTVPRSTDTLPLSAFYSVRPIVHFLFLVSPLSDITQTTLVPCPTFILTIFWRFFAFLLAAIACAPAIFAAAILLVTALVALLLFLVAISALLVLGTATAVSLLMVVATSAVIAVIGHFLLRFPLVRHFREFLFPSV